MDTRNMYWEIYDDQSSNDFDLVGYVSLSGSEVVVPIEGDLAQQVAEIRRTNGYNTEVKVYQSNEPALV